MRLFVAVDLSGETRAAMATEQTRIVASLGAAATSLKWVRPDRAHLTLAFLGQVDEAHVASLVKAVGQDLDAAPFELVFSGLGLFPSRGAPRVLWAGVGAGARDLTALHHVIAARVAAQGVALEERDFHPHLTLARWSTSRRSDRERALAAARPGPIARERVAWATLYESRLSSAGATYVALTRANLTRT